MLYDGVAEPTLHGIFAFSNGQGCISQYPAGHVQIEIVLDWIRAVTGIL